MIQKARTMQSWSAAKLRRARRLYVYLNFEALWNGGGTAIRMAARKARQRGLYSAKSGSDRMVHHSLVSLIFRLFRKANPTMYVPKRPTQGEIGNWHQFCRDHEFLWLADRW